MDLSVHRGEHSDKTAKKIHIHILVLREDVRRSICVKVLVETVSTEWTMPAIRWRGLEVPEVRMETNHHTAHRREMGDQRSPAWDSSHAGLVLGNDFGAPWVALGEELARRRHEVGRYPAVGTRDVGSFRIVGSVVWIAPLSDALRGGSRSQVLERRDIGTVREVIRTWTQST